MNLSFWLDVGFYIFLGTGLTAAIVLIISLLEEN